MTTSKIIIGTVGGGRYTVTAPIVKEDYGLYLKIEGLELPETYQVDFSNQEHNGTSVTMIGNADGVLIPHQFIDSGKDIFAFLYHVGDNYGRTVFKFRIPNKLRPDRTNEEPTPEEQSVIDQAISALNSAVEQTAQDVIDADQSAQDSASSAQDSASSALSASDSAERASASATDAQTSASQASASATASANSASQSAQIKADVEDLADDAQASANASAQSASASANSASQASGYAQSANASAQSASGYASSAQTSAQTASTKASEASTSASTASAKATESAQSASLALGYKNDAESAKTASQTAQGLAESARDDSEQIKSDVQDLADGIDTRLVDVEDGILKAFPTDTASGSVASFTDGADGLSLKSLVVNIDPVQDLHGYDSPWPAGGGKNLLNVTASTSTVNGVTYTVESDGTIKLSGTATERSVFKIAENFTLKAGTYKLNGSPQTIPVYCYLNFNGGGISATETVNSFDILFTLTEDVTTDYVRLDIASGTNTNGLVFKPMIRLSSVTDATYAPYENICPISGWTQVDVEQSGKNLWDEEWEVGSISEIHGTNTQATDRIRAKNYISVKQNTTYFFHEGSTASMRLFTYDANKNYIGYVDVLPNSQITTGENVCYLRFRMFVAYGTTYNHDISINYPSTDHDYHPYTGRSIAIDLGQTVYGGKLDVLSGVLTVDRISETKKWGNLGNVTDLGTNERRKFSLANAPKFTLQSASGDLKCNMIGVYNNAYSLDEIHMYIANSEYAWIYLPDTTDSNADIQLSYSVATPLTIQLTPHEVNSLLGTNNIFADTGDTSAEYRADTKLYISRLTEPDADMIADANIVSGQYFMVGNNLYKATANIASGASVIVGTNAIRKSLSEALNEINA